MSTTEERAREQAERTAAKETLKKMEETIADNGRLKTSLITLEEEVKRLKHLDDAFRDVDVKNVLKIIEQMRSGQEQIRNLIRTSKGGIYVPGLGENKEQFSLQRAAVAVASKNWSGASYEERVFKETRDAMSKGAGHIVGVDSQGGFFVPDQIIPDVIQAIYAKSVFISLDGSGTTRVSVINGLTGIPATIPKFMGGMIAYWIGEQDKYIESAVRVGNISMRPRKLGVLTRITDEMRRFSSYGFETLMRNDMTKAAAALLDYTIPYGTGTDNMPMGVFRAADVQRYYAETHSTTPPSGTANGGELTFDDLMNMQGVVEDTNIPLDSSWAWVFNPRYSRRRRQDKLSFYGSQTTGQGYLLGGPMMSNANLQSVIGPFATSTMMPSANTAGQSFGLVPTSGTNRVFGDVIGANWSDVLVGRWGGIEIAEDLGIGKGFTTDETFIKMRMYIDVAFRNAVSVVAAADAQTR